VILPLPPSANRYWRNVRGRMVLSSDAKAYRMQVQTIAALQWRGGTFPPGERVGLRLDVYMTLRGDLDNRIKQVLDALHGVIYEDDAQVWELRVVRHLDRRRQRVEVDAWLIEPEGLPVDGIAE